jgi:hypothetical protein
MWQRQYDDADAKKTGLDVLKPIERTPGSCYRNSMKINGYVSHDRREETPEAKTRWFRSLPMSERMDLLCAFTDLALTVNPALADRRNAQSPAGSIQVISAA